VWLPRVETGLEGPVIRGRTVGAEKYHRRADASDGPGIDAGQIATELGRVTREKRERKKRGCSFMQVIPEINKLTERRPFC